MQPYREQSGNQSLRDWYERGRQGWKINTWLRYCHTKGLVVWEQKCQVHGEETEHM
jgi:hypothetical protein